MLATGDLSGAAPALVLVLGGLVPLVLLWAQSGPWPAPPRRAFRAASVLSAACVLGAVWATGADVRLVCWVVLGSVAPLALVGAALVRAGARDHLLTRSPRFDRFQVLDAALNASRDGVLVTAARPNAIGLQIVYANPAFEELTGYGTEEALGQSPSMLYAENSDADRETIQAALRSGTAGRFEVLARRKDGSRVWVEWDVVPVPGPEGGTAHRVAVLRDTTGRRRLEEQLRQAAKLETVGRLAAGVAHDFNNLLTVIGGSADLLGDLASETPEAAQLVDEVRFAADRAGWLVRQLLTFSRPREAGREVLDLCRVVSDLAGILRR
ncbi:MAG TPA: PAS domain S-box protein, partial [Gemmata sp.]